MKKRQLSAALTCAILLSLNCQGAWAADTAAGSGNGVAIGTGSNAPKAENVAIGKGATISYSNGASNATGDIVIGSKAHTNNYVSQGGGIAIGENAFSENMAGVQEKDFNFGQTTFKGSGFLGMQSPFIPADPTKVVTGIAIGQNTYARTGGIMVGTHNYQGKMYDTTVDTSDTASMRSNDVVVNGTTVGTNSFNNAAFGVVTGAYSAITGAYDGGAYRSNASQNFGAVITGSLNSIESKTATSAYSGIATSITGVANRVFNSNGALIYGAGNEITNSVVSLYNTPTDGGDSPEALSQTLRKVVQDSNGGGATLAIGGGNKADYTQKTSIIGVNNTVTGTKDNISSYNSVTGFKNTLDNVQHVTVTGSNNTVTNTQNALVLGDNRTASGATGSVIIGGSFSPQGITTNVQNAVVLGTDANETVDGGVSIGAQSQAVTDKGKEGYDPSTDALSTNDSAVWKATGAAVSIGDMSKNLTRQITNVAAGSDDTDAVNVAQLKQAIQHAADNAKDTRNTVSAGDNVSLVTTTHTDGSLDYQVNVKAEGKVAAGDTRLISGDTIYQETRVKKDGTYIRKDYTAGENLTALDHQVANNSETINRMGDSLTRLDNRMDRVGAGAAAMAALHPQDFDPDDKWDFAAGYGNYRGAHAAAIGAFYRPTEDIMVSVGGSMGGGENLVNAGVTFKLGQHNHVSNSRVAMAKEIKAMRQHMAQQDALIAQLQQRNGLAVDPARSGLFPDVAENHWAYQYVTKLAKQGVLEGYPDGEFKGDRMMTRYEFAAIVYRLVESGAGSTDPELSKLVKEFSPELQYIRIDTVAKDKNGKPTIERVRVVRQK